MADTDRLLTRIGALMRQADAPTIRTRRRLSSCVPSNWSLSIPSTWPWPVPLLPAAAVPDRCRGCGASRSARKEPRGWPRMCSCSWPSPMSTTCPGRRPQLDLDDRFPARLRHRHHPMAAPVNSSPPCRPCSYLSRRFVGGGVTRTLPSRRRGLHQSRCTPGPPHQRQPARRRHDATGRRRHGQKRGDSIGSHHRRLRATSICAASAASGKVDAVTAPGGGFIGGRSPVMLSDGRGAGGSQCVRQSDHPGGRPQTRPVRPAQQGAGPGAAGRSGDGLGPTSAGGADR